MEVITRGDFDGLVCSTLLSEAVDVTSIRFAHPKIMQEGEVEVGRSDIIVNLPYHPGCALWFDHHISESKRGPKPGKFEGKYGPAPSCARLIYEYYNKPGWDKYSELLDAADKIDSARLDLNDILRPEGWVRLSSTVDPRSGFVPSHKYFIDLIDWIKEYPVDEILGMDDVRDRTREFFKRQDEYKKAINENSVVTGNVLVTDFRRYHKPLIGSRFLVYAMYPAVNVSARVFYGPDRDYVFIAVGHSILNRTCKVDVGNLLAEYGGGGHVGAGSCRVLADTAEEVLNDIVSRLNSNG